MSDDHVVGIGPDPATPGPDLDESWERVSNLFARTDSTPLFDLVLGVFSEQEVEYRLPDPEVTVVQATFPVEAGPVDLWVRTDEARHTIAVRSAVPGEIRPDQIGAALLLAARANRNVEVGSYEMDPDGGPLTFKTSLDVEGAALTDALFRALVGTALVAADVMAPLLADVLAGGDPRAAASRV